MKNKQLMRDKKIMNAIFEEKDLLRFLNTKDDTLYNYDIPLDLITKYADLLNWTSICHTQTHLTEQFIIENIEDIKLSELTLQVYGNLSENFMVEFRDSLNWNNLSMNPFVSLDILMKFSERLNWSYISCREDIDADFISKFKHKVDWKYVSIIMGEMKGLESEHESGIQEMIAHGRRTYLNNNPEKEIGELDEKSKQMLRDWKVREDISYNVIKNEIEKNKGEDE